MKTITEFPRNVVEYPNMEIVMPDGCRLSARVWMPVDAGDDPVPAILEHLPYRKRDGTVSRDQLTHPYFAGHGYASIRVDMRGNGDSEGLMDDEYSEQELQDAYARLRDNLDRILPEVGRRAADLKDPNQRDDLPLLGEEGSAIEREQSAEAARDIFHAQHLSHWRVPGGAPDGAEAFWRDRTIRRSRRARTPRPAPARSHR